MTHRFNRHRLACFSAWLLCSALYFWTAESISEEAKKETDPRYSTHSSSNGPRRNASVFASCSTI
jgi:hypothetical protein